MKAKIEDLLNLNQENTIQRSRQVNLYLMLSICWVGLGIFFVVNVAGGYALGRQIILGVLLVLFASVTWFIHQQHLVVAGSIILSISFIGANYFVFTSEYGFSGPAMYGYLMVIMIAGLLFGTTGITTLTILTLSVVWFVFFGQIQGWLINELVVATMSLPAMATVTFLWIMINLIFNITIWNLNYLIQQAHSQEQALMLKNDALQSIQASLEDMVQERTHKAEHAQKEAELARQQMEKQVWLMKGQAELATVMRGEQPIEALAQGIMTQICQYLQLPTGALFVMKEGVLNFVGGYAFMPHHDATLSFKLGEGLVGEAARKRTPLVLEAQAEQPWPVVFGTTVHQVQHIVVSPFLYEEAVMGVIELGSWEAITEDQMLFLQRNMESIGIAFHSAYTRDQMNILLRSL